MSDVRRSHPGQIPLTRHDGSVSGYATVDPEDYDRVAVHRWHLGPKGTAKRTDPVSKRAILMHREVLGLEPSDPREVDHIHFDKLDNRRSNLRIVTHAQNRQNEKPRTTHAGSPVSSQYRGVSWSKPVGKWRVRVGLDGKQYQLGHYENEAEAGRVAAEARRRLLPLSTI